MTVNGRSVARHGQNGLIGHFAETRQRSQKEMKIVQNWFLSGKVVWVLPRANSTLSSGASSSSKLEFGL